MILYTIFKEIIRILSQINEVKQYVRKRIKRN